MVLTGCVRGLGQAWGATKLFPIVTKTVQPSIENPEYESQESFPTGGLDAGV